MDNGVIPKPSIVFIGGSGRSGTNITKELLALHPDIATLPFEYRFIIDPNGIIDFYNGVQQNWSPYYIDSKIKQLEHFLRSLAGKTTQQNSVKQSETGEKDLPYADWELDKWIPGYSEYITQLIHEITEFSYSATWPGIPPTHEPDSMRFASPVMERFRPILGRFVYRCVQSILDRERKDVFVEDNTWNTLYGNALLDICPTGKLLHIVRDPRDVLASLRHQRWAPERLSDLIVWYSEVIQRWNTVKADLVAGQFLEVRLEDLAEKTEQTMKKILRFIEVPFHKDVLNFSLEKAHTGRWKTDFGPEEQALIQQELSDYIDQYHY